jgi:GH25 family lysozyme M1 (1,4-beta-N-acetylmuramidase)
MKKKIIAGILTFALSLTVCAPAFAEETPVYTLPLTGIDVSEHRGVIDWTSVKNSNMVQFAIIRDGFGKEDPINQTDDQFEANYAGATANGIKVGVYHYSYAASPEEAVTEAQFCLSILKGRHLDYPVFYDIEEKVHKTMTSDQISAVINAFCGTIAAAGYQTGLYSGANMYGSNLNTPALNGYDKWVAHYGTMAPRFDGAFVIWQYTSSGTVPGISGLVDMDYSYKDYSIEPPQTFKPVVPTIAKPTDNSILSDTGAKLTLKPGKSYTFKFTPNGIKSAVSFSTGNSGVIKVVSQKKIGTSYYVKITAGKRGCTSVYSTVTKQKAVSRCVVTVA